MGGATVITISFRHRHRHRSFPQFQVRSWSSFRSMAELLQSSHITDARNAEVGAVDAGIACVVPR